MTRKIIKSERFSFVGLSEEGNRIAIAIFISPQLLRSDGEVNARVENRKECRCRHCCRRRIRDSDLGLPHIDLSNNPKESVRNASSGNRLYQSHLYM